MTLGVPKEFIIKAGDIVATQSKSLSSRFIRTLTRSDWSHVAIATGNGRLLEATKEKNQSSNEKDEVRGISLHDFLSLHDKVIHLVRPEQLTGKENSLFQSYAKSMEGKKYTVIHAGLTAWGSFIWSIALTFFVLSAIDLAFINSSQVASKISYVIALASVALFLCIWALVSIWSFRTNFGVEFTEKIFCKTRVGRYLVKKKHDMFCSKLVLLSDLELGGELSDHTPDVDEVQPKHIVDACQILDWDIVEYKL